MNKLTNKILIIEDQKDIRLEMNVYFKEAGYVVYPAKHFANAIKILETKVPNLIIMEISMPGMDGFQFLEFFKKLPNASMIPIIFLSAKIDSNILKKIISYNIDNYLKKPFEINELNKIVIELLKDHKTNNKIFSPTK